MKLSWPSGRLATAQRHYFLNQFDCVICYPIGQAIRFSAVSEIHKPAFPARLIIGPAFRCTVRFVFAVRRLGDSHLAALEEQRQTAVLCRYTHNAPTSQLAFTLSPDMRYLLRLHDGHFESVHCSGFWWLPGWDGGYVKLHKKLCTLPRSHCLHLLYFEMPTFQLRHQRS